MSPAIDERTAPDSASGAVAFLPDAVAGTVDVPPLRERDFWVAVGATVLVTLTPWSR